MDPDFYKIYVNIAWHRRHKCLESEKMMEPVSMIKPLFSYSFYFLVKTLCLCVFRYTSLEYGKGKCSDLFCIFLDPSNRWYPEHWGQFNQLPSQIQCTTLPPSFPRSGLMWQRGSVMGKESWVWFCYCSCCLFLWSSSSTIPMWVLASPGSSSGSREEIVEEDVYD